MVSHHVRQPIYAQPSVTIAEHALKEPVQFFIRTEAKFDKFWCIPMIGI